MEKTGRRRAKKQPAQYRHELKYYINRGEYELLSRRLAACLELDPSAERNGGQYFIRSLYFDTPFEDALWDKLSGVDSRDKFRIRIYNGRDDVIKLECKHKEGSYIYKQSLRLSRAECDRLTNGDYGFLLSRNEPFARRKFAELATKGLQPRVLVDYWREAYVYPVEDVRITFDKDIRTAYRCTDIFDMTQPTYPVITDGDLVLEVKFNNYMPNYIRELLQISSHCRSAVSKYCICRKFEF